MAKEFIHMLLYGDHGHKKPTLVSHLIWCRIQSNKQKSRVRHLNPGFLFIPLHPHLSVLNIVLDVVQNLLRIRDSEDLEFHITEVD